MYTVQLYIFRVSQSMQPGNHIAGAAREMKRKEGEGMMLVPLLRPPVCRAAVVLAPSFPPAVGAAKSGATTRTNNPSVRPPDGRTKARYARARRATAVAAAA